MSIQYLKNLTVHFRKITNITNNNKLIKIIIVMYSKKVKLRNQMKIIILNNFFLSFHQNLQQIKKIF